MDNELKRLISDLNEVQGAIEEARSLSDKLVKAGDAISERLDMVDDFYVGLRQIEDSIKADIQSFGIAPRTAQEMHESSSTNDLLIPKVYTAVAGVISAGLLIKAIYPDVWRHVSGHANAAKETVESVATEKTA